MASNSIRQPEVYWTKPTPHVPNSTLPVLVYRNVLPADLNVDSATKALEVNNWMKGGVFKHFPAAHFHSNTPECYAALSGWTKCQYGVGPLDTEEYAVAFEMRAGDIAVHAPGVAHRNVESSDDYEYLGVYPKGAPHWDNNYCKAAPGETEAKAKAAQRVPIPDYDPIYGLDGPLPKLWRQAAVAAA